ADAVAPDWSAPPAEESRGPAGPAPAWNAPAVGASALEQLESEPPEPEPGAAKELFGTVPTGGMLAGDDDPGPPLDLDSPEEVLRPLATDHEDPDPPAAVDEPARPANKRAQPLAAFKPTGLGALEVPGEHRVAVHTRGGRTLRGTLRDVDLSKSQFPLVPQGGGEPEPLSVNGPASSSLPRMTRSRLRRIRRSIHQTRKRSSRFRGPMPPASRTPAPSPKSCGRYAHHAPVISM